MPIMATSFIQMAYSLTDMAWVGRLGSESMAAVGAVGILTWMSGSIALLNKVGAEVSVGQSIGARSEEDARSFASHNITIALLISVCWGGLLFLFARPILNIFELKQHITDAAVTYLRIVSTGLPFIFLSAAFTGIYNAAGRSKIPFYISGTGLIMNIVLDPLFIFGFGCGNSGRSTCHMAFRSYSIRHLRLQAPGEKRRARRFLLYRSAEKEVHPAHLQARAARGYAEHAICLRQHVPLAHRLGARRTHRTDGIHHRWTNRGHHLEYFARILHGAEHVHRPELCRGAEVAREASMAHHHVDDGRIRKPLLTTVHLLRQRGVLYLRTRGRSLPCGGDFLRIDGYSQMFMMMEITMQGVFYGLGRTVPPAIVSIGCNYMRIPVALLLVHMGMGVDAIWWAVSGTTVAKGLILTAWFVLIKEEIL